MTITWTSTPSCTTTEECTCGQDLEDASRSHCPRCGTQLKRAA